jgi:hypothetical protein
MSNTSSVPRGHKVTHERVMIVAAKVGCDPRTARKALEEGEDALRHVVHRERFREVIAELEASTAA